MNLRVKFIHEENAIVMENSMRGWVSLFTLFILLSWTSPVHAWMWEVGDQELSEVTGEGFSSFTLTDGVARAFFNINVSTYTQVDSLKMGYYNSGWDENWTDVSFGSSSEDLQIKGVYIEASFSNISDSATRQLNYIKVGTPDLTGPISADFNSFSGKITQLDGTVYKEGYRITDIGGKTLYGHNSEFSVKLDRTNGWWVEMNKATIGPK